MLNIDILKTFEAEEMGKFLSSIAVQKWYNYKENTRWLLEESEDGFLHKGSMVWKNQQWIFDKDNYAGTTNWVLAHIIDIMEAVLATGNITSPHVQLVIPAVEYGHKFDDFKDILYYKGVNFHIWSDFFDLKLDDIMDEEEAKEITDKYLSKYKRMNFMLNYEDLVNTIKIYYKNK